MLDFVLKMTENTEPDGETDESIEAKFCIDMVKTDLEKAYKKFRDNIVSKEYKFRIWKKIASIEEDLGFGQRALETDEP